VTDDIDRAQSEIDRAQAEAMRNRKPEGPVPTGRCLYCDDIVGDEQRWCGINCRDFWEMLRGRR